MLLYCDSCLKDTSPHQSNVPSETSMTVYKSVSFSRLDSINLNALFLYCEHMCTSVILNCDIRYVTIILYEQ